MRPGPPLYTSHDPTLPDEMKSNPEMTTRHGRIPRLYHDAALDGREFSLDTRQAHYLRQVLRLKRGHSVIVFDGRGREYVATIAKLTREGAQLRVLSTEAPIPESGLRLDLIQAITKAEAMDAIVQKATELGVHSISPVVTEFSVVKLDTQRAHSRVEHWRRIAQSACEQSGRHEPTVIHAPLALAARLASLPETGTRFALAPEADRALRLEAGERRVVMPVYVLVGPEGGLSPRDLSLADREGFERVTLGRRILRAETAAIAACALAQAYWGDLG